MLVPVILSEQLVAGSFAFALEYLVDTELDLTVLDARYRNKLIGASAHDPRVLLKIVLLAYNHGIVFSRTIERVSTQWHLYCLLHKIEKLAKAGIGAGENR